MLQSHCLWSYPGLAHFSCACPAPWILHDYCQVFLSAPRDCVFWCPCCLWSRQDVLWKSPIAIVFSDSSHLSEPGLASPDLLYLSEVKTSACVLRWCGAASKVSKGQRKVFWRSWAPKPCSSSVPAINIISLSEHHSFSYLDLVQP